jgi:NAD(P)-dependent dehydrogenase (short-subunit alcohol dehydrogenase family)/ribulose-5-phosphate 4-epimerase/fuculose-1-phosphate aldolase
MVSTVLDQLAELSNMLGARSDLVIAGGGNTSAKAIEPDLLGRERPVMHLKPSGRDLATIGAGDFCTLRIDDLLPLRSHDSMDDEAMLRFALAALVEPGMPRPSIEVLLHAFLPHTFVVHSHADALLSLTNHAEGKERVLAALGDRVAIVPYRRPGFELAKLVADVDRADLEGIVLHKHGLVTFGPDAETAWQRHVELVDRCGMVVPELRGEPDDAQDRLPELRGVFGGGVLRSSSAPEIAGFLERADLVAAIQRGPATADHLLRTGRAPHIEPGRRFAVAHGENVERASENLSIIEHTMRTVAACGPEWEPLDDAQLRHVEQWPLQQRKKADWHERGELAGKVALITGAASGIGRAIADRFGAEGAHLVLCDLVDGETKETKSARREWVVGDVSVESTADRAISAAVRAFGGLDIVVSNAGIARPARVEELTLADWEQSFAVNSRAHFLIARASMRLLRRQGLGGSIVFNASKNVLAPGKGFAAYSAAKASEAQLAKVLALEAADMGVRVNTLHPDAVFAGTKLWSDELRRERARAHSVAVEDLEAFYAERNLLKRAVRPADVAEAALFFASERSSRTTGAYLTVDGGVREAFAR